MQCERCKAELSADAKFCPECGQIVERESQQGGVSSPAVVTPPAFVPASHSIPAPSLASPIPGYTPTPSTFFKPAPRVTEESDFYHIDAMEKPDFEAMRGISILLIIVSICTMVGILFPMPLAIVSLVSACGGIGERDPLAAKRKFDTCRTLVIVTVVSLLVIFLVGVVVLGAMGYLAESMNRGRVAL